MKRPGNDADQFLKIGVAHELIVIGTELEFSDHFHNDIGEGGFLVGQEV